jgi:hypothetical protein
MKGKILLAAALLSAAVAGAAEPVPTTDTCGGWNSSHEHVRIGLVVGWLKGVEAADKLTSDIIIPELWQAGHRVGSVVLEIDVQCARIENRDAKVGHLIQAMAREKNQEVKP